MEETSLSMAAPCLEGNIDPCLKLASLAFNGEGGLKHCSSVLPSVVEAAGSTSLGKVQSFKVDRNLAHLDLARRGCAVALSSLSPADLEVSGGGAVRTPSSPATLLDLVKTSKSTEEDGSVSSRKGTQRASLDVFGPICIKDQFFEDQQPPRGLCQTDGEASRAMSHHLLDEIAGCDLLKSHSSSSSGGRAPPSSSGDRISSPRKKVSDSRSPLDPKNVIFESDRRDLESVTLLVPKDSVLGPDSAALNREDGRVLRSALLEETRDGLSGEMAWGQRPDSDPFNPAIELAPLPVSSSIEISSLREKGILTDNRRGRENDGDAGLRPAGLASLGRQRLWKGSSSSGCTNDEGFVDPSRGGGVIAEADVVNFDDGAEGGAAGRPAPSQGRLGPRRDTGDVDAFGWRSRDARGRGSRSGGGRGTPALRGSVRGRAAGRNSREVRFAVPPSTVFPRNKVRAASISGLHLDANSASAFPALQTSSSQAHKQGLGAKLSGGDKSHSLKNSGPTQGPPQLWRDIVRGSKESSKLDRRLHFVPPSVVDGCRTACCSAAVSRENAQNWQSSLVGRVMGGRPFFLHLRKSLERSWKLADGFEMYSRSEGIFLVKFSSEDSCSRILEGGPWFFEGRLILLRRWEKGGASERALMHKAPLWIRLPLLPVELWSKEPLSDIVSVIGTPLYTDKATALKTRYGYARCCVEVGYEDSLPESVPVTFDEEAELGFMQEVVYEWKPQRCRSCKTLGHVDGECQLQPPNQQNQAHPSQDLLRWRRVRGAALKGGLGLDPTVITVGSNDAAEEARSLLQEGAEFSLLDKQLLSAEGLASSPQVGKQTQPLEGRVEVARGDASFGLPRAVGEEAQVSSQGESPLYSNLKSARETLTSAMPGDKQSESNPARALAGGNSCFDLIADKSAIGRGAVSLELKSNFPVTAHQPLAVMNQPVFPLEGALDMDNIKKKSHLNPACGVAGRGFRFPPVDWTLPTNSLVTLEDAPLGPALEVTDRGPDLTVVEPIILPQADQLRSKDLFEGVPEGESEHIPLPIQHALRGGNSETIVETTPGRAKGVFGREPIGLVMERAGSSCQVAVAVESEGATTHEAVEEELEGDLGQKELSNDGDDAGKQDDLLDPLFDWSSVPPTSPCLASFPKVVVCPNPEYELQVGSKGSAEGQRRKRDRWRERAASKERMRKKLSEVAISVGQGRSTRSQGGATVTVPLGDLPP